MTWLVQEPLADEACEAPMTRRDMILPRVEACIMSVTARAGWARDDSTHLLRDLWLTGEGIMRLGELLEEEFGITLLPSALIDLALTNPTLGGVLRMLERKGA
jgi:hypothetical protein